MCVSYLQDCHLPAEPEQKEVVLPGWVQVDSGLVKQEDIRVSDVIPLSRVQDGLQREEVSETTAAT